MAARAGRLRPAHEEAAMRAWTRILCAVDFSTASSQALERAAELARSCGASLTLLHVHEPAAPSGPELPARRAEAGHEPAVEHGRKLERWRAEAERLSARRVAARLAAGAAAAVISEIAREQGCDLVVTGSHARRGTARTPVGSVAERVVREAHCAVLVVREAAKAAE
jgi:universal stress protein A